jgi:hypothetical protein
MSYSLQSFTKRLNWFGSSQNAPPKDFANVIWPFAAKVWLKDDFAQQFDFSRVLCMPKPNSVNYNCFTDDCIGGERVSATIAIWVSLLPGKTKRSGMGGSQGLSGMSQRMGGASREALGSHDAFRSQRSLPAGHVCRHAIRTGRCCCLR